MEVNNLQSRKMKRLNIEDRIPDRYDRSNFVTSLQELYIDFFQVQLRILSRMTS